MIALLRGIWMFNKFDSIWLEALFRPPCKFFRLDLSLSSYRELLFATEFVRYFNILIAAVGAIVLNVVAATLAGYGLTWFAFPGKETFAFRWVSGRGVIAANRSRNSSDSKTNSRVPSCHANATLSGALQRPLEIELERVVILRAEFRCQARAALGTHDHLPCGVRVMSYCPVAQLPTPVRGRA